MLSVRKQQEVQIKSLMLRLANNIQTYFFFALVFEFWIPVFLDSPSQRDFSWSVYRASSWEYSWWCNHKKALRVQLHQRPAQTTVGCQHFPRVRRPFRTCLSPPKVKQESPNAAIDDSYHDTRNRTGPGGPRELERCSMMRDSVDPSKDFKNYRQRNLQSQRRRTHTIGTLCRSINTQIISKYYLLT